MEVLQPYEWLQVKPSDLRAKVTIVNPAGGVDQFTSYELTFEDGQKIVLKDEIVEMLFERLNIAGYIYETFEQVTKRLLPLGEELKDELVAEAKSLGIKSAHLLGIDKLKEKIAEAKKG